MLGRGARDRRRRAFLGRGLAGNDRNWRDARSDRPSGERHGRCRAAAPPPASLKCTKMRLVSGRNGTAPPAVAKMPKVGVALAPIIVETLDEGVARHAPVAGLVWQIVMASGRVAAPVLAVAVIAALA